jgi:acyl dehydratase
LPAPSDGPYFDDLSIGDRYASPAYTLSSGAAAVHRSIVGDRLALTLDASLALQITGSERAIAHPALVWNIAIGQSTVVTRRVIANLFYRGLVLRRAPRLGDTLRTATEVVALRETTRRPGRAPVGLAALRIVTTDQAQRRVLDFWRCAMLPLRSGAPQTGHDDDLEAIPSGLSESDLLASWAGWRTDSLAHTPLTVGDTWRSEGADVVSCAPELARLTLNVAIAHHDRTAGRAGERLVYGGHTIGIAAAQLTRMVPGVLTFAGWHGCDHPAPVFEGDLLRSWFRVEAREGPLVHLRCRVEAERGDGHRVEVLDWRPVVVLL